MFKPSPPLEAFINRSLSPLNRPPFIPVTLLRDSPSRWPPQENQRPDSQSLSPVPKERMLDALAAYASSVKADVNVSSRYCMSYLKYISWLIFMSVPDLNVPSGPDPLPEDKACHRCKVLSLPCVVDDSNRKQRKRKDPPAGSSGLSQGQETPEAGPSTSKRQEPIPAGPSHTLASKFTIPSQSSIHAIDHSLDLLPGLSVFNGQALAEDPVDNFEKLKRELGARGIDRESGNTLSIKLHGRPLELTCAMLRVAYGRKEKRGKRMKLEDDEIEVDVIIDEAMMARLAPGYVQFYKSSGQMFTNFNTGYLN